MPHLRLIPAPTSLNDTDNTDFNEPDFPDTDPGTEDGCRAELGTFTSACGKLRPLKLRRTHLRYPGGCNAVGGDPRTAGPSVALTRCGHVTTGWTCITDYEEVGPLLGLRYVENGHWQDSNSLWGRLCDGPPGKPARGPALEQLKQAWRTLLSCWHTGIGSDAPRHPATRFVPPRPGAWLARPQVRDDRFVSTHGALAVACGWGTFSALNVPERGYRRHLQPLGLSYEAGVVHGAVPPGLAPQQWDALHREAWLGVLEAYLAG